MTENNEDSPHSRTSPIEINRSLARGYPGLRVPVAAGPCFQPRHELTADTLAPPIRSHDHAYQPRRAVPSLFDIVFGEPYCIERIAPRNNRHPRDRFCGAVDRRTAFLRVYRIVAARQPCVAIVRDGAAVSVCFSSRKGRQVEEA